MIKGFIFDLDGTLLDSLSVWETVDDLFLQKRGIEVTQDYHEALLHLRFEEAAHYTIKRYGLNESPHEIMNEWMNLATMMYHNRVTLKKGAYELIHELKRRGCILSIVTSCHQELFEPCLRRNGIWECFDYIIESNRVKMSKTQSDIYQHVLTLMNLQPEECVFIDDVYSSLKAASMLGIHVIGINDELSYDEKTSELTKTIIKDFTELSYKKERLDV